MNFDFSALENIQNKVKELSSAKEISFQELFTPDFMAKYTQFDTIEDFITNSPFDFAQLESINENELDYYIQQHSTFTSWKDMKTTAASLWFEHSLQF